MSAKTLFCGAARHANSHLRKTMTAHSPHALPPPAHYAAARDNTLLLPRPLPYPRTPGGSRRHTAPLPCTSRTILCLRTARTPGSVRQRAPRLRATPQPIRRRAHASRQSATHSTLAPLHLAAASSAPSFASRASFLTPSPPCTGANAGAPMRMRGFMRK